VTCHRRLRRWTKNVSTTEAGWSFRRGKEARLNVQKKGSSVLTEDRKKVILEEGKELWRKVLNCC